MMTPQQLKNSILQRAIEGKLVPCDLSKWKQVKLGDVCDFNPRNKIDDELEVSFVSMTMVADGYKNKFSYSVKKWKEIKKGYTHFADGDIAFAKITPCFQNRKSLILNNLKNGFGAGTTELVVLRPHKEVISKYILWIVKSEDFIRKGVKSFKGTAGQQRIDKDFARNYEFLLPSIDDQKRIVAKLEELLPLVDEYAQAYEQLQSLNAKFPGDLKKSLLQYAMEGKLVPCDLSKWKQVKLGDVCSSIRAGGDKPQKFSEKKSAIFFVPVIANGKKNDGIIGYTDTPTVFEPSVTVSGRGTIGWSCVRLEPYCPIVRLLVLVPLKNVDLYFLQKYLIVSLEHGVGTSIQQLTVPMIKEKIIPLPPIDDQKRIVAKLEELLPLCDELKS